MRILSPLFAVLLTLRIPSEDVRNTYLPDFNTHFTMPAHHSLPEWEARKAQLRAQILQAAGLYPVPAKTPLNARVYGRVVHEDYSIAKVLIETFPGYYLGGNLYEPRGKTGPFPGVLTPHGHWKFGRLHNEPDYSVPALAVNMARQGYVVFAYDMVGYNDSRQTTHNFGGEAEDLWSLSPMGLQLWNSVRALDYLAALPNVDATRIGVTGASGGATQTFLLSAIDDRVRVSAPVNMISATMQGGDPCEEAAGLRIGTFNAEIAAMMAPRNMLMVATTRDWTRNTPIEEYPDIQNIYRLYGHADRVGYIQFDAPHNYNQSSRESVYRYFASVLMPDVKDPDVREQEFHPERDEDLLVLRNGVLPDDAVNYEQFFDEWRLMAERQLEQTSNPEQLKMRLARAIGAEWPTAVVRQISGHRIVLSRDGRGDRVSGLWIPGKSGEVMLVVHPKIAEQAKKTPEVEKLIRAGNSVLILDAFQSSSARSMKMRTQRWFFSYNRSDEANRVQDILTALSYLNSLGAGRIHLLGFGAASARTLFAAAVAPIPVRLSVELGDFHGTDENFRKFFFVPGIQRAGGLKAALRVTEEYARTTPPDTVPSLPAGVAAVPGW